MRRTMVLALCLIAFTGATALGQEDPSAILRKKAEERLAATIGGLEGVAGMAALDLTSGERFGVNEEMVFPQGSAIKIPVLMEVYRQAAAGRFDLRDRLWVTKKRAVGGSGILQFFGDSTSALSVRDLCMLMITQSDNTATNMLIDLVGMESVNATLAKAGLKNTRLQRRMMDTKASARGDENLSTPSEAMRIMEMLHAGTFADARTSREILDMLRLPKGGEF